jgi:hypothetical protein
MSWRKALTYCGVGLLVVAGIAPSWAADLGVTAKKLVLVDRPSPGSKAVYVSKLDVGLQKGAAGDPALLSGTFEWFYTDEPSSVGGSFTLPSSLWVANTDAVAKFSFDLAVSCAPTCVKIAKIKPATLAVVKTKGYTGFDGPGNLDSGPPSDSGGITTVLTILNGNDSSVHRMCTKFAVDSGSTISYTEIIPGSEAKLVARNGVPTTCPP